MTTWLLRAVAVVLLFVVGIWTVLVIPYWTEVAPLCKVSPESLLAVDARPLIEYYVHGRGMGHFQRSTMVSEFLNHHGYDVRLFLPDHLQDMFRSSWDYNSTRTGITTLATLQPLTRMDPYRTFVFVREQIRHQCQLSWTEQRFPMMVITDGDVSGMYRAAMGSIPVVSLSHGQVYYLAEQPPSMSKELQHAWGQQYLLNMASAIFANYVIAVHFDTTSLVKRVGAWTPGQVVPPMIRPAVLRLARVRRGLDPAPATLVPMVSERPLVVCYFRDGNGLKVVEALLRSDINVVLFDRDTTTFHAALPAASDISQLTRVADPSLMVPYLYHAHGVASSAGFQLMSECIAIGLPMLAMHTEKDTEQRLNVAMSPGFVTGTSFEDLGRLLDSRFHLRNRRHVRKILDGFLISVRRQQHCARSTNICALGKATTETRDARDVLLGIVEETRKTMQSKIGLGSGQELHPQLPPLVLRSNSRVQKSKAEVI